MHDAAACGVETIAATIDGVVVVEAARDRLASLLAWGRAVRVELEQLPVTLRTVREAADNFQVVSQRLSASTTSLEDIAKMYEATIADAARRSTAAAETLRRQVESLGGLTSTDRLPGIVDELQRNLDSLARLNPLWPRSRPAPESES